METKEQMTLPEIERLCQAYVDCRLSKLQEKELELVLLSSGLTTPIIAEVRTLMRLTTLMAANNSKPKIIKKGKLKVFKYTGIAACVAVITICTGYVFMICKPSEEATDIYACVDGKVLTGYTARNVVNDIEKETMEMFLSIIEDAENEQRLSKQFMNSIIE